MKNLTELLKIKEQADAAYYNSDTELMSDQEYDALKQQIRKLQPTTPLPVGAPPTNQFNNVKREVKMLSLRVDNNPPEKAVTSFDKRVISLLKLKDEKIKYVLERKADGISVDLYYREGTLAQALTRGDGETGEDITENIMLVNSVPKILRRSLHIGLGDNVRIHGELTTSDELFERYNSVSQIKAANPRSLVNKLIRNKNSRNNASFVPDMTFFAYRLAEYDNQCSIQSHEAAIDALARYGGFCNLLVHSTDSSEDMVSVISNELSHRPDGYSYDGLVLKVDNLRYQEQLSVTSEYPNWAVVFKYPSYTAITTIEGIHFNVGRTGVISATASLTPVMLNGCEVSKVSLAYGSSSFDALGFEIGLKVELSLAGDVIPKITRVIRDKSTPYRPYRYITHCPSCDHPLSWRGGDGAYLYCTNGFMCEQRTLSVIENFVSKNGMDIAGLSSKGIKELNRVFGPLEPAHLFTLPDICYSSVLGDKTAQKIISSLARASKDSLFLIARALSIPGITTLSFLRREVNPYTFREFLFLLKHNPLLLGVTPNNLKHLSMFLSEPNTEKVLEDMSNVLTMNNPKTILSFKDKTFYLYGIFTYSEKEELAELIEAAGGKAYLEPNYDMAFNYIVYGSKTKLPFLKRLKAIYKNSIFIAEDGAHEDFYEIFGIDNQ